MTKGMCAIDASPFEHLFFFLGILTMLSLCSDYGRLKHISYK